MKENDRRPSSRVLTPEDFQNMVHPEYLSPEDEAALHRMVVRSIEERNMTFGERLLRDMQKPIYEPGDCQQLPE